MNTSNAPKNMTTEDRIKVRKAIMELDASMTRKDAESGFQKDVIQRLHDDLGIDKKIIRKMARTYHKGSFQIDKVETEEFETSYIEIMSPTDAE